MANLHALLRQEMSRIARKEIRAQTGALKSSGAASRRGVAQLKREVAELRRAVAQLKRGGGASPPRDAGDTAAGLRFSAKSVAAQRRRLGLSAADFARLVGVTGQTVYNWEGGKRPRAAQLAALAEVRKLGRRDVQAKLEAAAAPARRRPAKRRKARAKR